MTRERRNDVFDRTERDGRLRPVIQIWRQPSRWTALTLLVLAMAGGCAKKTPTATAPPPPVAQAQDQTAPVASQTVAPQPGQPTSPLVQADGQPDLGELNRTLIRWIVRNRRQPANFGDFAASAGVAIPPPPPGKQYVIGKNMHIQLVSQ